MAWVEQQLHVTEISTRMPALYSQTDPWPSAVQSQRLVSEKHPVDSRGNEQKNLGFVDVKEKEALLLCPTLLHDFEGSLHCWRILGKQRTDTV